MKKKIIDEELLEKIDSILELENRAMSIKEITLKLKLMYDVNLSPQIVLRHLDILKRRKKAREE